MFKDKLLYSTIVNDRSHLPDVMYDFYSYNAIIEYINMQAWIQNIFPGGGGPMHKYEK